MTKFSVMILIIFCLMSNPVTASLTEFQQYLSKLIAPVDISRGDSFATHQVSASEQDWLDEVDARFEAMSLDKHDAKFAMSFAEDGSVRALSLLSCAPNLSLGDFRSLVANLMAIRVPSLPATIRTYTVFELDANWSYVDRPSHEPIAMTANYSENLSNTGFEQILRLISSSKNTKVKLDYPNYIDYPYVGQLLKFRLESNPQILLRAYVLNVQNSHLQIKVEEISNLSNKLITDLSFEIERPSIEFRDLSAKMLGTAISSAATAGVTGAVLTNGIAPGALAVLGATAILAQEHVEEKPYYLSKGDEVILKIGGDTNERNIDLWSISSGDNWSVSTSDPRLAD